MINTEAEQAETGLYNTPRTPSSFSPHGSEWFHLHLNDPPTHTQSLLHTLPQPQLDCLQHAIIRHISKLVSSSHLTLVHNQKHIHLALNI